MVTFGNYWGNEILQYAIRDRDVWLALHTSNPGPTGLAGTELAGYGYERVSVNFTVPASRTTLNSQVVKWENLPAATITHIGLWDASTGGNIISYGALTPSEAVAAHSQLVLEAGEFAVLL